MTYKTSMTLEITKDNGTKLVLECQQHIGEYREAISGLHDGLKKALKC